MRTSTADAAARGDWGHGLPWQSPTEVSSVQRPCRWEDRLAEDPGPDLTHILSAAAGGDEGAARELLPLVYEQLRALAASHMRNERPGHTLPPTALVHEVYLRLVREERASWRDRAHFFAVAATAMRRILVNHARDRKRLKRGGDRTRQPLDELADRFEERSGDLGELDAALERLRTLHARQAEIVELRFFAGLGSEQIAELTGRSTRSVERDWAAARAWLKGEIERSARES